jgi:type IV pilus assembly protein PilW
MVGIAVGLFVVAGASLMVATSLGDNRRLLLETQLQQDLRAAADIIARELRRAGAHDNPAALVTTAQAAAIPNEYTRDEEILSAGQEVQFNYRRPTSAGPYAFKLEGGVIKTLVGGTPQALTDVNTLRVTTFNVQPIGPLSPAVLPCAKVCASGGSACWPTIEWRGYQVDIEAQSVADPNVRRNVRSVVRTRNDRVIFRDGDNPNRVCPL